MPRALIAEVNVPCSFVRLYKIITSSVWYYITAALFKPFVIFQKTLSLKWGLTCKTSSCFTDWYNELTHVLDSSHRLILSSKRVNSLKSPAFPLPTKNQKILEHNAFSPLFWTELCSWARRIGSIHWIRQIMLNHLCFYVLNKTKTIETDVFSTPITYLFQKT